MQLLEVPTSTAPSARTSARLSHLAISLALLTALILRAGFIGHESLWFDEGYTAWMVAHSPREIIRLILADTAPPLYYLLTHFWTQIFGSSEAALRSLSALFSLLTFLLALSIAKRTLKNPPAVAAAAWLMALSFLQTWYAREARAYALMAFLAVASFDVLQRHLASNHRRWLIPQTLLIAAAMFTHNMMAPYVMATLLTWLILPSPQSSKRRLVDISLVILASFLLYLPWALIGLPAQIAMISQAFWVDPLKRGNFLKTIVNLVGTQHYWSWAHLLRLIHLPLGDNTRPIVIIGSLMIASTYLSIFRQDAPRRREAIGLLTMAMFPLIFVALYSVLRTPLFMPKIFLPSTTFMSIFVVLPLGMPLSRPVMRCAWAGFAILLAFSALTLYSHNLEDPKEDWRSAAKIVSDLPPQNRLIIFDSNDGQLPFDYYYHYRPGDLATGIPTGFFDLNPPRTMLRILVTRDLQPLQNAIDSRNFQQIVLVLSHLEWCDRNHLTESFIARHYPLTASHELTGVTVQCYAISH